MFKSGKQHNLFTQVYWCRYFEKYILKRLPKTTYISYAYIYIYIYVKYNNKTAKYRKARTQICAE